MSDSAPSNTLEIFFFSKKVKIFIFLWELPGSVQSRRAGVDQLGSFFFEQNLHVDENLGYRQKHIAVGHLLDDISDDLIEGSCPIVKSFPDKVHPLSVVPLVGRNQTLHVSDVFPVPSEHVFYVKPCKSVE